MANAALVEKEVENQYEYVNYIGLTYEISKMISEARDED